jgi:hypothetical protein
MVEMIISDEIAQEANGEVIPEKLCQDCPRYLAYLN